MNSMPGKSHLIKWLIEKRVRDYLYAFVLVACSITLDTVLRPYLHRTLFFLPLTAITLAAVFGGYGPGIFATFLASVSLDLFPMTPRFVFFSESSSYFLRLGLFLPSALLVSAVGGRLNRALEIEKAGVKRLCAEQLLRERIVAGLAHDLRNPLAAAKMSADLALIRLCDRESVTCSLVKISKSIERIDTMIEGLLDVARTEAGRPFNLHIEEFDLVTLVNRVIRDYEDAGYFHIKLAVAPKSAVGDWDQSAIRRILNNLLDNALKYGQHDHEIEVRIRITSSKTLAISVKNDGEPIALQHQGKLFDYFERAANTNSVSIQGWGIGLSVVKGLTEAHGGSVSVSSDSIGGTIFTVELPLRRSQLLAEQPQRRA